MSKIMHWEINNSLDILMHNREQALIKMRPVEKAKNSDRPPTITPPPFIKKSAFLLVTCLVFWWYYPTYPSL